MPSFPHPARLMLLSVVAGVFVGACSSVDPSGPSVELSLNVGQPAALPSTMRVEIGSNSASLRADAPSGSARTVIHVSGYGQKAVQVTLVDSQSDTLATVSFPWNLQADYEYGIGAMVSRARPLGICVGTITATPLRNSPGDSLFVARLGMPKGAVC